MKKRYLFLIILFIEFFTFKTVFARDYGMLGDKVDYRFFVENESGGIAKDLEFKITDKYNLFSYTQKFNKDYGYYYFENTENTVISKKNIERLFTSEEWEAIESNEYTKLSTYFDSENVSVNFLGYDMTNIRSYYKYYPMLLEEINPKNGYKKIEKMIYSTIHIIPLGNTTYFHLTLINSISDVGNYNSFSYEDGSFSYDRFFFFTRIRNTRRLIYKYEGDLDIYNDVGIFTSKESTLEEYINRVIPSSNVTDYDKWEPSTPESNVSEHTAEDIRSSLPVLIRYRKIVSPLTANNKILILIVSFVAIGSFLIIFEGSKKNKLQDISKK